MTTQLEKFVANTVTRPNGCIEWTRSLTGNGYGRAYAGNKKFSAHRLCWILNFGDIPNGLWVLHRCDNRICVNPDHLFLGTRLDNIADMVSKGRQTRNLRNKLKTHCPRGHEYTEANTYLDRKKSRCCKECARLKAKERYVAKNGADRKQMYRLTKKEEAGK